MSSEIVLNGTKLWEGTTVVAEEELGQVVLFFPGDGVRVLAPSDELVVDGEVITGPRAGWKFEMRQIGLGSDVTKSVAMLEQQIPGRQLPGSLLRDCWFKGKHSSRCEKTAEGWVCSRDDQTGMDVCTVEDLPTEPRYVNTVDTVDEVVSEVARKWFRVYWRLIRHSHRLRFTNGRAVLPQDELISRAVWYQGKTWTKWGARRQIAKIK